MTKAQEQWEQWANFQANQGNTAAAIAMQTMATYLQSMKILNFQLGFLESWTDPCSSYLEKFLASGPLKLMKGLIKANPQWAYEYYDGRGLDPRSRNLLARELNKSFQDLFENLDSKIDTLLSFKDTLEEINKELGINDK